MDEWRRGRYNAGERRHSPRTEVCSALCQRVNKFDLGISSYLNVEWPSPLVCSRSPLKVLLRVPHGWHPPGHLAADG